MNAFNSAEWAGIAAEIKAFGEQDAVRVIVISAEGKGFCAGVDIKEGLTRAQNCAGQKGEKLRHL
ncbi:MAG: hypothetical protein CM15mP125_4420 [Gammaproteobacteria bacterium]|nr:MAG: hypothetical protein CM15mP125_4420 [Gammaproteobacteria bacterium]